jgi:hypothetical protein
MNHSPTTTKALLEAGEGTKRRAATAMNERSSRAHSLFIMTLEQKAGDKKVTSQLFLADLGGSEQVLVLCARASLPLSSVFFLTSVVFTLATPLHHDHPTPTSSTLFHHLLVGEAE